MPKNNLNKQPTGMPKSGPMGHGGGMRGKGEKAKDFKGTMKKLLKYQKH